MTFKQDFLWGGATAANQLEGAFDVAGKGLSVADAMPGGKSRMQILGSDTFDWSIDADKYVYPNHKGIDHYHRFKEDIALFAEMGFNVIVSLSPGHVFSQWVMKQKLMKQVLLFMNELSMSVSNMVLSLLSRFLTMKCH